MGSIQLKSVTKAFGPVNVINGVDLNVNDGEFTVFVGPSGCGKSTLLRLIAGLEDVTAGQVLIDAKDMTNVGPSQRGLAMVFQSYALYPHMSVRGNIAFALKMAGQSADVIEQKVRKAASTLNLTDYLDRKPRQLSGGQRQRVAIGRAIVREPKAFLFDEPLSNLDAALRVQMRVEIGELHNALKTTMIYVTHDQVEAMTMADKIVVLQAGRVEQVGSPLELYHHPANLFVAGFIGSPRMNLMEAKVVEADARGTSVSTPYGPRISVPVEPGTVRIGDTVTLGIRPEGLRLDPNGPIAATVALVERLGGLTLLHITGQGNQPMIVQIEGSDATRANDQIRLAVDPAACHLFDKAGQALPQLVRHPLAA
jgi:multiple sugar transport system ATP-binding protein